MKKFFISVLVSLLIIVMAVMVGWLYLFHSLSSAQSSVQPAVITHEQPSSINVSPSDISGANSATALQTPDDAEKKDNVAGSLQQQGLSIGQSFLRWALDAPGVDPMTTAAPAQAEPSSLDLTRLTHPSEEK